MARKILIVVSTLFCAVAVTTARPGDQSSASSQLELELRECVSSRATCSGLWPFVSSNCSSFNAMPRRLREAIHAFGPNDAPSAANVSPWSRRYHPEDKHLSAASRAL